MSGNKKTIRRIGIWDECPGIYPHPSLLMPLGYTEEEKEGIARYIEQTPRMIGRGTNPFNTVSSLLEGPEVQLSLLERCDECWAYHDDLAYYVRKGVKLPEAVVQHVRTAGYRPPRGRVDYRLVNDDYGGYWIFWSVTHSRIGWMYLLFFVRLLLLYPLRLALWPLRHRVRPI